MRTVLVLLSVLLMAACASGSGSPSKLGSPVSMAGRAPSMTEDEVADYVAGLTAERIDTLCRKYRSVTAQLTCARDALLRGFDTTGEAERHCDVDVAIKEAFRCVVFGSLGFDIARAAQIPAEQFNWSDPSAGVKEAGSAVAKMHLDQCVQGAISAVDACIVEKLGGMLNLTGQQVATCTDKTNLENSVRCLVRTHMIEQFESAVARMVPGEVET